MDLKVGAKVLINITCNEERRIKGFLSGWLPKKYLCISTPLFVGIREYMDAGRILTTRYVLEGTVYGFKSKVLNYINKPESLIFMAYPEQWETIELRNQERLSCTYPCAISHNGSLFKGIMQDISPQGCRITFGPSKSKLIETLKLGKKTDIVFFTFDRQNLYQIEAQIVNASKDMRNKTSIGFKFTSGNTETLEILNSYIQAIKQYSA